MAHNRTITHKVAEGCEPSACPDRRIRPSGHGPAEAEPSHAFAGVSTITRSPSPKARAKAKNAEARTQKRGATGERSGWRAAGGGYGGQRPRSAGAEWNARGPLAQTQSGFGVGDRVVNASGRGVWGLGTIVAVIPAGVNPRWWCRRNGWPLMFGRCETVHRPRYVVRDDRGKLVVPRKVERVPENAAFRTREGIESLYGRCR